MRILIALFVISAVSLAGPARAAGAVEAGRTIFQQKCVACHTIGGGKRIGPDLRGVTSRRPPDWLERWISTPDQMLAAKDTVAVQLLGEYAQVPMPNLGLSQSEVHQLIDYLRAEDASQPVQAAGGAAAARAIAAPAAQPLAYPPPSLGPIQRTALALFLGLTALIAAVFAAVAYSTKFPRTLDVHKAYGVRRAFFFIASAALLIAFVATIGRTPYAAVGTRPDRIIYVTGRQFNFVFSLEPIVRTEDLSRVPALDRLVLPAGTAVEFRVTALDVNHNFALYGPEGRLLAQTQAMPGYVNRLRVLLAAPGRYSVLCLEYCGAAHHLMQTELFAEQASRLR